MSQLVLEHYEYNTSLYNTSRAVLFLKTVVRIRLDAHIRTSLNKWQANPVLLSIFILCNLLFCNDAPTTG
jgi:hypothetical protein